MTWKYSYFEFSSYSLGRTPDPNSLKKNQNVPWIPFGQCPFLLAVPALSKHKLRQLGQNLCKSAGKSDLKVCVLHFPAEPLFFCDRLWFFPR